MVRAVTNIIVVHLIQCQHCCDCVIMLCDFFSAVHRLMASNCTVAAVDILDIVHGSVSPRESLLESCIECSSWHCLGHATDATKHQVSLYGETVFAQGEI